MSSESIDQLLSEPAEGPHLSEHRLAALASATAPRDAHLSACPRCQEALSKHTKARARFLERAPSQALLERLQTADQARQPQRLQRLRWGALALAAGLALLAIGPGQRLLRPDAPKIRTKGNFSARLYVRRGAHRFQASADERFLPGDALRIELLSAKPGFATIALQTGAAEDGSNSLNGSVEVLEHDLRLQPQRPRLIQGSFVLDDTKARERLLMIFSERSLSKAELKGLLKAGGAQDKIELLSVDLSRAQ